MKLSKWQYKKDGLPKINGIYQIKVKEYLNCVYYARFKDGKWGAGFNLLRVCKAASFSPFKRNNDPKLFRPWRGVL